LHLAVWLPPSASPSPPSSPPSTSLSFPSYSPPLSVRPLFPLPPPPLLLFPLFSSFQPPTLTARPRSPLPVSPFLVSPSYPLSPRPSPTSSPDSLLIFPLYLYLLPVPPSIPSPFSHSPTSPSLSPHPLPHPPPSPPLPFNPSCPCPPLFLLSPPPRFSFPSSALFPIFLPFFPFSQRSSLPSRLPAFPPSPLQLPLQIPSSSRFSTTPPPAPYLCDLATSSRPLYTSPFLPPLLFPPSPPPPTIPLPPSHHTPAESLSAQLMLLPSSPPPSRPPSSTIYSSSPPLPHSALVLLCLIPHQTALPISPALFCFSLCARRLSTSSLPLLSAPRSKIPISHSFRAPPPSSAPSPLPPPPTVSPSATSTRLPPYAHLSSLITSPPFLRFSSFFLFSPLPLSLRQYIPPLSFPCYWGVSFPKAVGRFIRFLFDQGSALWKFRSSRS